MFRACVFSMIVLCLASHGRLAIAGNSGSAARSQEPNRAGATTRQNRVQVSGRAAVSAVRHNWKASTNTLRTREQSLRLSGAVPKNFGRLSPETRLQYLQARRNLAPGRFDRYHPWLGRILRRDDQLRAALAQNCQPVNGLVPNTRYWRYIRYRRSLAPARFDYYHPALGAIVVEDQRLRSGVLCPPAMNIPTDVAMNPPQAPQGLNPPGTPSPSGGGRRRAGRFWAGAGTHQPRSGGDRLGVLRDAPSLEATATGQGSGLKPHARSRCWTP